MTSFSVPLSSEAFCSFTLQFSSLVLSIFPVLSAIFPRAASMSWVAVWVLWVMARYLLPSAICISRSRSPHRNAAPITIAASTADLSRF